MAGTTYSVIEIFTSEEARWHGSPLYEAIVQVVAHERSAARCIVTRGIAGAFENGEVASHRVMDISYNMPVKIEIILPLPELDRVLPRIEEMVTDGIVLLEEREIRLHRTAMIGQEHLVEKTGLHATPGLLAALSQGSPEGVPELELFPPASARMTAKDVMTSHAQSIGADDLLIDAVRLMAKANLKRLPVLDKDKHLAGMLSRIDVLRLASAGTSRRRVLESYGVTVAGSTPISQANLLDVSTVSPETPAREVLDAIDNEGRRVVVLGEGGAPLGLISDKDLLPLLDPKHKHKIGDLTARSLMRTIPTIVQSESVEEALRWMVENRRQRLPVVDGDGKYVGILSREELLRILAPTGFGA